MSAIILDQTIVHYEAMGRGRPIVFLHSWVGSWRYWIAAMQVASTSFRAYALDLFGYGDTAHDSSLYSLAQQASLVARFLDEIFRREIARCIFLYSSCLRALAYRDKYFFHP